MTCWLIHKATSMFSSADWRNRITQRCICWQSVKDVWQSARIIATSALYFKQSLSRSVNCVHLIYLKKIRWRWAKFAKSCDYFQFPKHFLKSTWLPICVAFMLRYGSNNHGRHQMIAGHSIHRGLAVVIGHINKYQRKVTKGQQHDTDVLWQPDCLKADCSARWIKKVLQVRKN